MPFGLANAPALFQELMNKILYILRRRPLVQELISRGADMEAHIDDVSLGTNTQEDHVLLLREFFIVCQENHLRIKLEKCEFMKEEMEYLGLDMGYGWCKPAASKLLQDWQIRDDPKKGLHEVRSFVGACNFYRHHIHNFTYSSAPLTDLIKETTPWRWAAREEECVQELEKKIASSNCLGVPCPKGETVLITDASDVMGGGIIYQWQELNPAELTDFHYRASGLNRDGSLKHDYPTSEWRLVPLGHWNWKWNQARSSYSTHDQELLACMLLLSSQSGLLGSNPIVWLCDQELVKSFQKGPPPEKEKLKRWWTYLSQFRLTVHHIPGIINGLSDYISRNNFDTLIGESSEALAKEASQRMDVQPDLSMRTAGILEGWSRTDYQSEYKEILQTLSTGPEPRFIDWHQWYKNNQYLFYEDCIVVPEARNDGCLQWAHLSSGNTGANRLVDFFRECFYSTLTLTELRSRMQTIVDACGCHASKQSNSRDRGLISGLPIPYCSNSLLYVHFIHGLPRFGGYDSCLVVTCGLSRFTRVFLCKKKITAEQTGRCCAEQWLTPPPSAAAQFPSTGLCPPCWMCASPSRARRGQPRGPRAPGAPRSGSDASPRVSSGYLPCSRPGRPGGKVCGGTSSRCPPGLAGQWDAPRAPLPPHSPPVPPGRLLHPAAVPCMCWPGAPTAGHCDMDPAMRGVMQWLVHEHQRGPPGPVRGSASSKRRRSASFSVCCRGPGGGSGEGHAAIT